MVPAIRQLNLAAEFDTPEGCFITELSAAPDDPQASIARTRVAPGVTTRWHRLKGVSERYVILEGEGRMEVGELPPQDVRAGDVVLIPSLCRQRITNIGKGDLIFLCICIPGFTADVYEDLEENA